MDIERIKQNFRIRTGRARKTKKRSNPPKPNGLPLLNRDPSPSTVQTPEKTSPASTQQVQPPDPTHSKNTQEPVEQDLEEKPDPAQDSSSPRLSRKASAASQASSLALQPAHSSAVMSTNSDSDDFDLAPPKPRSKPPSIEDLAELLFSSGHLDSLLQHPPQLARFSAFLQRYSPQHYPLLTQYLETRKAVKAIEYANAVAQGLKPNDTGKDKSTEPIALAAKLDPTFEAICNSAFDALVGDALPSYVSYSLVKVASECMTNEITGRSTPVMRDLVDGLSEVFCLTDPNQDDNPIIYASEEFYRLTRYGPDDVINANCRFLQGRKTNPQSPKRLKHAVQTGEEISEALLNYRRDGRPFINLLMIAPLHDKNGKLKYHIGAQIDVSGLVQGGRALAGFQRYLTRREQDKRRQAKDQEEVNLDDDQRRKKRALARLRDLSETFDLEETAIVQAASRSNSVTRDDDDTGSLTSTERQRAHRRVFVESDSSEYGDEDGADEKKKRDADWTLGDAGDGKLSGKLPGVYDSFILFRPAPSFRIVFISPKLRRMGDVLHAPFLSHVAAPNGTLNGLVESLKSGVPVSAKVHFMPERGERREGTKLKSGSKHEDGKNGRAIWVSCTPLLGADDSVGVWMCVVVEKSKVGSVSKRQEAETEPAALAEESTKAKENKEDADADADVDASTPAAKTLSLEDKTITIGTEESSLKQEDIPIKPVRVDSDTVIKAQVEKSPASAKAGSDQTSNTVHPQQSIDFDAKQGADIDQEGATNRSDVDEPTPSEEPPVNKDQSSLTSSIQDRDPRAVVTPVEEYEEPKDGKPDSYKVATPSATPPIADTEESDDEYVATHSPVTSSPQAGGRVLIEEDSDAFQDSDMDMDHQRDNLRVGRRIIISSSTTSLNSPASEIPPSVPSSAMGEDSDDDSDRSEAELRDDAEGEPESQIENESKDEPSDRDKSAGNESDKEIETPTQVRRDRSATPPDADNDGNDLTLGESHATIKPTKETTPADDSDRDSAISLNSPAQQKGASKSKPKSRSPSRSSTARTASQKTESNKKEEAKTVHTEILNEDELETRERDVETWVKEGRPPTSRTNSGNPSESRSHKHNQSNASGHSAPGIRLDYLGAGSQRWTRASRVPRRMLDTNFGDYSADDDDDEEDDAKTTSDHCATSPTSVD